MKRNPRRAYDKEGREIEVKLGVGHGLLYKPFKEWVDPAVEWANGR